jgi:hypothetical protein
MHPTASIYVLWSSWISLYMNVHLAALHFPLVRCYMRPAMHALIFDMETHDNWRKALKKIAEVGVPTCVTPLICVSLLPIFGGTVTLTLDGLDLLLLPCIRSRKLNWVFLGGCIVTRYQMRIQCYTKSLQSNRFSMPADFRWEEQSYRLR